MNVIGGPFAGEEHDVSSAWLQERGVLYVSALGERRKVASQWPPGETGIVEYVNAMAASYVAGLPTPARDCDPASDHRCSIQGVIINLRYSSLRKA